MKKIKEHTYGSHVYMRLEIDGTEYEIDVYFSENGETYRTTAEPAMREAVISAFKELY